MISLSIIIPSYNTKNILRDCLASILSSIDGKFLYEVIVVDNASTDGSPSVISRLRQDYGGQANLKLIQNKGNLGFAKGCNIGARQATGKYILFLNSDTKVQDNGFLQMVEFLEKNPRIGILGGKLHNPDGSVQPSAGKFYNLASLIIMLLGLERLGFLRSSPNTIQRVDWVSGACMMVRRDIFEKLLGFDEKLFMYMEDMEICFRAQKLGFATYFYPNLKLEHKSWGSSNRTFAIINIYKGILHFYSKHKNSFEYTIAKTLLVTKAEILILIGFLTFNKSLVERYRNAIS